MKKLKTLAATFISTILMLSAVSVSLSAKEPIDVRLNGKNVEVGALLIGATTYVPFDSINDALSLSKAKITGSASEMISSSPFAVIKAREGECYLEAEGRYFG